VGGLLSAAPADTTLLTPSHFAGSSEIAEKHWQEHIQIREQWKCGGKSHLSQSAKVTIVTLLFSFAPFAQDRLKSRTDKARRP
jgi:hypothetical protein